MAGIDPVSNVADAAAKIIGLFKADPNVKQAGQIALDEAALQGQIQTVLAQIAVDQTEAMNQSVFVAGWRPFIGWVCGCGVAYGVVIQPFATFIAVLAHNSFDPKLLPTLDMGTIITLLGGLLGLGAMKTYEKTQGVTTNH